MTRYLGIKEIWQADKRTLAIKWTDNSEKRFDVVALRKKCPCAVCTDEMTGKRNPANEWISDTVSPTLIKSVGRYALTIQFNDGHGTGIYTYDYLTRLND
jgi:DUF971 family protein